MPKKPISDRDAKVPKPGVRGGPGITAGGNVKISDVRGQVAIGSHIKQKQTISSSDKQDLLEALKKFREEVAGLEMSKDDLETVKGDVNAAIKEAEKEKPDFPKIQSRFQGAIDTVKETGQLIKKVAESPVTQKIVGALAKWGLAIAI